MKFSKKWLEKFLSKPLPEDSIVAEKITFGVLEIDGMEKVEGDTVFDVKVLPNRSHDCLGHWGLAKELSVLTGISMNEFDHMNLTESIEKNTSGLKVSIQDKRCNRYIGAVIKGVNNGPSPEWLKQLLESIGQKSINTVVDITNFVMFSVGQPMHAFDLSKVPSKASLIIRSASKGEKISTLGGGEVELNENDMVIASESGEALALAGVKGGNLAEITDQSSDIILESASFNSSYVRKSSRSRMLITESSKRFENGLHPNFAEVGMRYAIKLIEELTGGKCESVVDIKNGDLVSFNPKEISFSHSWLESVLGVGVNKDIAIDMLKKLSCKAELNGEEYKVAPPWWRLDLVLREDIAEEIIRLIGLDKIPSNLPSKTDKIVYEEEELWFHNQIRKTLFELGFIEIFTSVFLDSGKVELENPLAKDKAFLRDSLSIGMTRSISMNEPNRAIFGKEVLGIFEIGKIFDGLNETWSLCLGACDGTIKRKQAMDLLKKAKDEIFAKFGIELMEKGNIFEAKGIENFIPKEKGDLNWGEISKGIDVLYKPFSPYPHMVRDVSFWGDVDSADKYEKVIKESAGDMAIRIWLFDQYTKERTSYAFRMVLQAKDKTLTDEEANKITEEVHNSLKAINCEIR